MATDLKNVRDEIYVMDLCDEILGQKALRQYRFDFLRGDGNPGRALPVDAYYPALDLVIEYREKQHSERVAFWDDKTTVSGVSRAKQRRRYDQRRRDVLPANGIHLVEISYNELAHGHSKRLERDTVHDLEVLQKKLVSFVWKVGC